MKKEYRRYLNSLKSQNRKRENDKQVIDTVGRKPLSRVKGEVRPFEPKRKRTQDGKKRERQTIRIRIRGGRLHKER